MVVDLLGLEHHVETDLEDGPGPLDEVRLLLVHVHVEERLHHQVVVDVHDLDQKEAFVFVLLCVHALVVELVFFKCIIYVILPLMVSTISLFWGLDLLLLDRREQLFDEAPLFFCDDLRVRFFEVYDSGGRSLDYIDCIEFTSGVIGVCVIFDFEAVFLINVKFYWRGLARFDARREVDLESLGDDVGL